MQLWFYIATLAPPLRSLDLTVYTCPTIGVSDGLELGSYAADFPK